MSPAGCECLDLGPRSFDEAFVGVDRTNGRFGEVSLRTCRACGRRWLHYLVEYEAFSRSGRWYLGLLPEEATAETTPEGAVPLLEALPWHVYGGSYWGTSGRRSTGPLHVDLLGGAAHAGPQAPAANAMEPARRALVSVLREARSLLARPGNDFTWSSWADAGAALREVDGLIAELESGQVPRRGAISILFAPTGPMQEAAVSSGWVDEFLAVADRCDAAVEAVYGTPPG